MVLPHNSALISCVLGKAWLPARLKGFMTIASPVALAGSLSPLLVKSLPPHGVSVVNTAAIFLFLAATGGGSPEMLCV